MQWWNDFLDWLGSRDGQLLVFSAIIPFVAIVVAGIVAALIGRGATRRVLAANDRENRIAAVATMIGAARRASVWNTLGAPEQQHADHVASEADVRVRLIAMPGAGLAANWAAHEIAAMKRNSVSFSFQAEQSLVEFRERMVMWQARPSRAKKLFKNDLDLWAHEDSQATKDIISQQQAWAASQVADGPGVSAKTGTTGSTAPVAVASESSAPSTTPGPSSTTDDSYRRPVSIGPDAPPRPAPAPTEEITFSSAPGQDRDVIRTPSPRESDGGRGGGGTDDDHGAPALVEPRTQDRL